MIGSSRPIASVTDLGRLRADDALIDRLGRGSPGDDVLTEMLAAWRSAARGVDVPPARTEEPSGRDRLWGSRTQGRVADHR
jgi:hypothetical protein